MERLSPSPAVTRRLAETLGRLAGPGQVVALFGPLGAGKTQFVKGLASGLDVPDWDLVASPTFTLVARYRGRLPLLHVDAFRLDRARDLLDLGFEECIEPEGVTAMEWADRAGSLLPPDRLEVRLEHEGPSSRRLRFSAFGARSRALLDNAREKTETEAGNHGS